jgi:(E)-4-hydroxy-3-methylbut-2-enyl-diphosphate synthase
MTDRYINRPNHDIIQSPKVFNFSPFRYDKRESEEIVNIGGDYFPVVISDLSFLNKIDDKHLRMLGINFDLDTGFLNTEDTSPDYIYVGDNEIDIKNFKYNTIVNYDKWLKNKVVDKSFPLIDILKLKSIKKVSKKLNFISLKTNDVDLLNQSDLPLNSVLIIDSNNDHFMPDMRAFFLSMSIKNPVIINSNYNINYSDKLIVHSSTDLGGLFIQGMGDGIFLRSSQEPEKYFRKINSLSFKILQAARVRVTATDFISCPSCGRTLFDLQKTTAMIRERTDHLKGLKIGIMGCIVNGPGEMADADYGYVGSGKDKITLYRGQEVVKRAIKYEDGVDELIELIKDDGNWVEPK